MKSARELTITEKCEGRNWNYNLGNRVAGIGMYSLSMICMSTGSPLAFLLRIPLAIEGAGDAVTGRHHYISRRVYEAFGGKNWFREETENSIRG